MSAWDLFDGIDWICFLVWVTEIHINSKSNKCWFSHIAWTLKVDHAGIDLSAKWFHQRFMQFLSFCSSILSVCIIFLHACWLMAERWLLYLQPLHPFSNQEGWERVVTVKFGLLIGKTFPETSILLSDLLLDVIDSKWSHR